MAFNSLSKSKFILSIFYYGLYGLSFFANGSTVDPGLPRIEISLQQAASKYNCQENISDNTQGFLGVLQPSESGLNFLTFKIKTENFNRRPNLSFKVMYTNNGYNRMTIQPFETFTTSATTFKIPIYDVSNDFPFAVNQVIVSTEFNGESYVDSLQYRVYRSIMIQKSSDNSKDCMTMFKAENISGMISNSTDLPRSIEIIDNMTKGRHFSTSFSRGWLASISIFGLANINGNFNWLSTRSQEYAQTTTIRVTTLISPGNYFILTRQLSLMQDAYQVFTVNECGQPKNVGTIFYRHWVVSYPVARVNMSAPNPFANLDVGYNDQLNTCEGEGPLSLRSDQIFMPDKPLEEGPNGHGHGPNAETRLSNPQDFNEAGRVLEDETIPKRERKGRFLKMIKNIFKR